MRDKLLIGKSSLGLPFLLMQNADQKPPPLRFQASDASDGAGFRVEGFARLEHH